MGRKRPVHTRPETIFAPVDRFGGHVESGYLSIGETIMADARNVLNGLGHPVTIERGDGPVTLVKGRTVQPTFSTIVLDDVSIQPMSAEEIREREELERARAAIKIYSVDELKPTDRKTKTPGDLVLWNGKKWRVVAVEYHGEGVLDHYKSIAKWTD
jgi:hypothetical protein